MRSMRHHTTNAAFFVKSPSQDCGYAKGPSEHCGTGVSPVSPHGPEARATGGFDAGARRRRGVTLLEILVLISIFSLVFAILVPSLAGGHNDALSTKCMANLREIGTCTSMYILNEHGRRLIPWYQYPAHEGYNINLFTPWVFGGFKAPIPDPYGYDADYAIYPAEIRPLNKIAYPEARGSNTIDLYICPSDDSQPSSWEASGTSYPLNTRFMQGYALPSGNFSLDDAVGEYTDRIAEHMLGAEASSFIVWCEGGFYSATYSAGPTIDGIGGGPQPQRQGWHGKFSQWSVGFADGHAAYGYFDTRQIYGLGGTIWQPNFDHGL